MSGFLICFLCELAGRPSGERFTVPAGAIGRALMEQHVLDPHPAACRDGVCDVGRESIDVALTGGEL